MHIIKLLFLFVVLTAVPSLADEGDDEAAAAAAPAKKNASRKKAAAAEDDGYGTAEEPTCPPLGETEGPRKDGGCNHCIENEFLRTCCDTGLTEPGLALFKSGKNIEGTPAKASNSKYHCTGERPEDVCLDPKNKKNHWLWHPYCDLKKGKENKEVDEGGFMHCDKKTYKWITTCKDACGKDAGSLVDPKDPKKGKWACTGDNPDALCAEEKWTFIPYCCTKDKKKHENASVKGDGKGPYYHCSRKEFKWVETCKDACSKKEGALVDPEDKKKGKWACTGKNPKDFCSVKPWTFIPFCCTKDKKKRPNASVKGDGKGPYYYCDKKTFEWKQGCKDACGKTIGAPIDPKNPKKGKWACTGVKPADYCSKNPWTFIAFCCTKDKKKQEGASVKGNGKGPFYHCDKKEFKWTETCKDACGKNVGDLVDPKNPKKGKWACTGVKPADFCEKKDWTFIPFCCTKDKKKKEGASAKGNGKGPFYHCDKKEFKWVETCKDACGKTVGAPVDPKDAKKGKWACTGVKPADFCANKEWTFTPFCCTKDKKKKEGGSVKGNGKGPYYHCDKKTFKWIETCKNACNRTVGEPVDPKDAKKGKWACTGEKPADYCSKHPWTFVAFCCTKDKKKKENVSVKGNGKGPYYHCDKKAFKWTETCKNACGKNIGDLVDPKNPKKGKWACSGVKPADYCSNNAWTFIPFCCTKDKKKQEGASVKGNGKGPFYHCDKKEFKWVETCKNACNRTVGEPVDPKDPKKGKWACTGEKPVDYCSKHPWTFVAFCCTKDKKKKENVSVKGNGKGPFYHCDKKTFKWTETCKNACGKNIGDPVDPKDPKKGKWACTGAKPAEFCEKKDWTFIPFCCTKDKKKKENVSVKGNNKGPYYHCDKKTFKWTETCKDACGKNIGDPVDPKDPKKGKWACTGVKPADFCEKKEWTFIPYCCTKDKKKKENASVKGNNKGPYYHCDAKTFKWIETCKNACGKTVGAPVNPRDPSKGKWACTGAKPAEFCEKREWTFIPYCCTKDKKKKENASVKGNGKGPYYSCCKKTFKWKETCKDACGKTVGEPVSATDPKKGYWACTGAKPAEYCSKDEWKFVAFCKKDPKKKEGASVNGDDSGPFYHCCKKTFKWTETCKDACGKTVGEPVDPKNPKKGKWACTGDTPKKFCSKKEWAFIPYCCTKDKKKQENASANGDGKGPYYHCDDKTFEWKKTCKDACSTKEGAPVDPKNTKKGVWKCCNKSWNFVPSCGGKNRVSKTAECINNKWVEPDAYDSEEPAAEAPKEE